MIAFSAAVFAQEIDCEAQYCEEQESEVVLFEEEEYLESDEVALDEGTVQYVEEEELLEEEVE